MGGGGGVGVLSTVIILLPSLSCRSLCSPCVGSASFNHVSTIRGPIFISAISLPVAIFASAMCCVFCLRGPVLWPVSSYVATLFPSAIAGLSVQERLSAAHVKDERQRERRGV